MNILVVSQYYYPEPFRIHDICECLVAHGHAVTVLTTFPNYPEGDIYPEYCNEDKRFETINGVQVYRCKSRPRKRGSLNLGLNYISFAIKGSLAALNLKEKYDIIYVYQLSPIFLALPAILLKKRYKIPIYLYCLDIWPESIRDIFKSNTSLLFKFVKEFSRWIYSNSNKIGVTSKAFTEYLNNSLGLNSANIEYLPQYAEDIQENDCTYSIENDCIDFVFLGNIGLSQNLTCVANAVKLVKTNKNFLFHIVGTGSAYETLIKHIKQIGVEDKFVFYGRHPLSEMPQFYRLADVCLLSLINDNSVGMTVPGKLQGYMSAGKAILASIDGSAADVIDEAKCGLRVAANDSFALAKAITYIVEHSELIKVYEKNSRNYYEKHFSRDIHISNLEKSLLSLFAENKNNHDYR